MTTLKKRGSDSNPLMDLLFPGNAGPKRQNAGAGQSGGLGNGLNMPSPLSDFYNSPISPLQTPGEFTGPLSALINPNLMSGLRANPNASGGINKVTHTERDQALGSKVAHTYQVKTISRFDDQVFQPQGTPLWVVTHPLGQPSTDGDNFSKAICLADPPLINFFAHEGYLTEDAKKIIPDTIDGLQQVAFNPLHIKDPKDLPYSFLGISNTDRLTSTSSPTSYYPTYDQIGHQQSVFTHGSYQTNVFNLFGDYAVSGTQLYAVWKEFEMGNSPIYNFSTGAILRSNPPKIRDTVLQLRLCADVKGGGYNNSGESQVHGEDDWFSAQPKPRECDLDYVSRVRRIDRIYKIIEMDEFDRFTYRSVEGDVESLSNLVYDIYETGFGEKIGHAKFGWKESSPNYEWARNMGHVSRLHMAKLTPVSVMITV